MKTKYIVKRIRQMENIMDEVIYAFKNSESFWENKRMKENVKTLTHYMDSGIWRFDYEKCERGELPKKLKCGVLSEDTLYNLICDIEQAERDIKNNGI